MSKRAATTAEYLKALDIILDVALVELRYEVGLVCVLPAALQSIEHDSTQLLDVVLLPRCTEQH